MNTILEFVPLLYLLANENKRQGMKKAVFLKPKICVTDGKKTTIDKV